MTNPNPYKTDPYKRRLKKKASTDDEVTEVDPATNTGEEESDANPTNDTKPLKSSSFSADAIKRRLAKDKYKVG